MIFYKRNDPNQISKLIDFETRDYEQPIEEDVSYTSFSDLDGHHSTSNIYRYSNNNSHNNSNIYSNNTSQITSNKNLNNYNINNKTRSKYQNSVKRSSNTNLPIQNNNNSFNSQLSEYAIQRSFNEQIQDKSDENADSDCSVNFESRKREYKPSKNQSFKTNEDFLTKKSFVSHYPSPDNFQTKNTLNGNLGSEKYVAPKKNRAGYTKENYISDKNVIDNMFTNSRNNLRKSVNNIDNSYTNSEFNNSIMNTNNMLGMSMASVSNLVTYYDNNIDGNLTSGNPLVERNINNNLSNYHVKSNHNNIEIDNNRNFYNNLNNSVTNSKKLIEIKEEHETSLKAQNIGKSLKVSNLFISENPNDQSLNYYESRRFDMDSNNNFQSNIFYDNKDNRIFMYHNNQTNNDHLSNNDLDILEKIKINRHNDSDYYNYDSDPK